MGNILVLGGNPSNLNLKSRCCLVVKIVDLWLFFPFRSSHSADATKYISSCMLKQAKIKFFWGFFSPGKHYVPTAKVKGFMNWLYI